MPTEAGDGAEVLVLVVDGALVAEDRDEVLRELLGLADGVLGVRDAHAADAPAGEVGDGRDVAAGPRVGHDGAVVDDAQVGLHA